MSLKINNNPFIDSYNLFEHVIRTDVTDLNPTRRNLPTSKERQWIFPYTPEELAGYYPRIAIVLNSISYSEFGSNQFVGYQTEPITGEVTDAKMNYVTLSLTIGIFTKKKDKYSATLPGNEEPQVLSGILLNSFLFGEVQKSILRNREYLITNGVEDYSITNISSTYTNNEFLFSSNINISVVMPNIWGKVYTAGELINIINEDYTVEKVDG